MAVRRASITSLLYPTAVWKTPPPTGGMTEESGGYRYHRFIASGSFVVPVPLSADVLIVAAGGGAKGGIQGDYCCGGGGAGGLISLSSQAIAAGVYAVSVGDGVAMDNGNNTTFLGQTAIGGGANTNPWASDSTHDGGSGAGANAYTYNGTTLLPGYGTSGQGYNGGRGGNVLGQQSICGGGGGGAGAVGGQGYSYDQPGAGGAGVAWNGKTFATGGSASPNNYPARMPENFTGNGAHAGPPNRGTGGLNPTGATGIVIVKYAI